MKAWQCCRVNIDLDMKLKKCLAFFKRIAGNAAYGAYLWLWVRPQQLVELMFRPEFYTSPTYYPEYPDRLRSHWSQYWNQVGEILRFGRINTLYFLCGYDVMTREEQKQYVHYNTYMRRRKELNNLSDIDYTCVLRDKLHFSMFLDSMGVKGGKTAYYTQNGVLYDYNTKSKVDYGALIQRGDGRLFCKPLDGQCGNGIFVLKVSDGKMYIDDEQVDLAGLQSHCSSGRYLIQEFVEQHTEMSRLHPQSVNTIRLLTVRSLKDGQIYVMPSILRIGTGDSIVDNTSQGGLAVGIDLATGYLKQFGFYKPDFGLKTDEHPDSHVRFSEFQIPYFEEAKRQAILLHSMLPGLHSVGWDIAIGPDGPIFIEGNDNWEITGPQTCNGGFRKVFEEYFFE